MPQAVLRLGTRASALARAQAEQVRQALATLHPDVRVELVFIRTSGDRGVAGPLPPAGAKGLFVKEIEEALLAGAIEAGVHSMKDLPASLAAGLAIGAVPVRAAAHDVLIGGGPAGLADLAPGARVGTSSVRRRAQVLALRRDVEVVSLRGNVDTRLRRWRAGELDAIVLAAAGLARLGIDEPSARPLGTDRFVPAVGQGALALECRADDAATRALLAPIEDRDTAVAVAAERAFQAAIGGDCNTPLAAHATIVDGRVSLHGMVSDADGKRRLEDSATAPADDADGLGRRLAERLLARGARDILGSMKGRVYLVGAGPGDPGLLTRRAEQCLAAADVVVHDYLVPVRLLAGTRADAEVIVLGRSHDDPDRPNRQAIDDLLIDRARAGKTVVRLKNGDPFLFGRGGEEAEALARAGIPFEIVPGVSASFAAPAYAGIPLTHRDHASLVTIVTGHQARAGTETIPPALPWEALARQGGTLVFLMGMKQLHAIMDALVAHGLDPATPAAAIRWGTTGSQATETATVATLAGRVRAAGLTPPACVVVGGVVRLRERLRWFEDRPLFGRRMVVTRPRAQAGALSDLLEEQGAEVLLFPTIALAPAPDPAALARAVAAAGSYDWIVFTSANAVHEFFAQVATLGKDVRDLAGVRVAAIGPETAAQLAQRLVRPALVPSEFRAEGLLAALSDEDVRGRRFLLPRAAGARAILPESLRARGAVVDEVIAYRAVTPPDADVAGLREALEAGTLDALTFTSSSTVRNFVDMLGATDVRRLVRGGRPAVACIGPVTADTARELGLPVDIVPAEYTAPALARAVTRHFCNGRADRLSD